jgi:flagellar biosynthesis protein FliQ
MESGAVTQLIYTMLIVTAKVTAPILLTALAVGLTVSLFQAVTQINDATLGFLPKVIAVLVVLWISVPWIVTTLVEFTTNVFSMMEHVK